MRGLLSIAIGAALWLAPGVGVADDVPGQAASAFVAAADGWLDNDEQDALPELARLAREGNAAARMLLALIDRTPAVQGPWLAKLPRDERIALLRAPGGVAGTSWMHEAAAQTPLAQLWLSSWAGGADPELGLAFAAAGEHRAARAVLLTVAARQRSGFADHAAHPAFPPGLRVLVWRDRQDDPAARAQHEIEVAALAPGDPQLALLGVTPDPSDLAAWLLDAPEAGAAAQLCRDLCAAGTAACVLAVHDALGGVAHLLAFGSPLERVVPAERFHASRRGQGALLRRILLNADARGRRLQIARAREADGCFGDLLDAEAQRYMPQLVPRD